jgi:hypothetical protein
MELVPANGLWNFPMSDELSEKMDNILQAARCEPDYYKSRMMKEEYWDMLNEVAWKNKIAEKEKQLAEKKNQLAEKEKQLAALLAKKAELLQLLQQSGMPIPPELIQ